MMASLPQAGAQTPATETPNPDAPVYVVRYIDVLPSMKKAASAALKQVREACRTDPGNLRCEIAERLEQQNQFVVLEIWKDQKRLMRTPRMRRRPPRTTRSSRCWKAHTMCESIAGSPSCHHSRRPADASLTS